MRGDGTIDEKEEAVVEGIAAWMGRYGAAIYGTRPWRVFGEGPTSIKSGDFSEGKPTSPYTASDIRYVRKGTAVHAFVLGWPENGVARLPELAKRGTVRRVTLPGSTAPLEIRQGSDALYVTLPAARRDPIGVALVVEGDGLV
jgi:alpha-L-fucosidase